MRLNNPTRFTDPFGYVSSGSEHDAVFHHHDEEDDSPNLSDLVECFLEQDTYPCRDTLNEVTNRETANDSESDRHEHCLIDSKHIIEDLLQDGFDSTYKRTLVSHVAQAIKTLVRFGSCDKVAFNRNVMYFLRKLGYNAAICKSKWDSSGNALAAGTYEFIDVQSDVEARYFIDLNFAAEFKIAGPTEHYSSLLHTLPTVIITTEQVLKKVIKVVAEEARRSLKSRDLHIPPWRKNRYMQMKWFGPYKRTTNLFPTTPLPAVNSTIPCNRFVGFEVGIVTEDANGRYNNIVLTS